MRTHVYLHETEYFLARCQFPCRPDEDICAHVGALNILDTLWTSSLPYDKKTSVCALDKIMSLFILEDRQ